MRPIIALGCQLGKTLISCHQHLGTEHLFLGLLRETGSCAAKKIKERGITLEQVRKAIAESERSPETGARVARPRGPQIALVDEGRADCCSSVDCKAACTGEALAVTDENGSIARYQILEVTWSVCTLDSAPEVAEVVLKVPKEL